MLTNYKPEPTDQVENNKWKLTKNKNTINYKPNPKDIGHYPQQSGDPSILK